MLILSLIYSDLAACGLRLEMVLVVEVLISAQSVLFSVDGVVFEEIIYNRFIIFFKISLMTTIELIKNELQHYLRLVYNSPRALFLLQFFLLLLNFVVIIGLINKIFSIIFAVNFFIGIF